MTSADIPDVDYPLHIWLLLLAWIVGSAAVLLWRCHTDVSPPGD